MSRPLALLVDEIIRSYDCDVIAETGCFLGDTTYYLARRYPGLLVYSCDIDPASAAFTARRVKDHANAVVTCEESPAMLARVCARHPRPLAFLDAHWGDEWPLQAELEVITGSGGIAVIHDFDIGHERFSFDAYGDLACGPGFLERMSRPPERYHVLNPAAALPVPCLQVGRRAGVAVICVGLDVAPLDACLYLTPRELSAGAPR